VYTKLADKLYVDTTQYSNSVDMQGANAVQVEFSVLGLSGTNTPTVTLTVQISNDLENWSDHPGTPVGTDDIANSIGYATFYLKDIASQFARLKYTVSGTNPKFVIGVGVNTALL
jgi:hypothetical protein